MSKPFDATLKCLIDEHLGDWGRFLAQRAGLPVGGEVQLLDSDLSTTLQADRLLRIAAPTPFILHLELESSSRLGIPNELLRYNVFVRHHWEMPVHSVQVLLRPKANPTDVTGVLSIAGANGVPYLTFHYTVIRVWEESMTDLLAAGPGIAPLALLTNEANHDLPTAFDRFVSQLQTDELPSNLQQSLLGSLYVLCGLRYHTEQIDALYRNLSMTLEDSTTYQLILSRGEARGEARGKAIGESLGKAIGRLEEARTLIVKLGTKRFGAIPEATHAQLHSIADSTQLERIVDRLLDATDWADLLATT